MWYRLKFKLLITLVAKAEQISSPAMCLCLVAVHGAEDLLVCIHVCAVRGAEDLLARIHVCVPSVLLNAAALQQHSICHYYHLFNTVISHIDAQPVHFTSY